MALEVCNKQCDQCLFSKNRIVSAKRMKEIISDCKKDDSFFECHKGNIVGKQVVCAGFYARFSTQRIRKNQQFNGIKFVNPDTIIKDNINNISAEYL